MKNAVSGRSRPQSKAAVVGTDGHSAAGECTGGVGDVPEDGAAVNAWDVP